jgi:acyl-CoA synthetase (NDP forming)
VDLVVIAVPALDVLEVVEQCGRRGVDGVIVVSSGFGAFGYYGDTAMEVIVERARRFGMRVIGPESLGVINTDAARSMHATFADTPLARGRVGFLTQSGTLGVAALEHARRVGLGVSSFVDVGRRIDVSGNDLLQYWQDDPTTDVVAMYLESFGNPRKFTRIARRLGRTKPIVAVKSGSNRLLADTVRGPQLPEGWPLAATTDALLEQAGVVRVGSPLEMFDVCRVLAQQPVPRGRRVAIVSNSRGAATLTVDACLGAGLELAAISPTTRGRVAVAGAPTWASRANPVDLTHEADAALYAATMEAVLTDEGVDAVLVIYAPSFPRADESIAAAIVDGVERARRDTPAAEAKPVVATLLGADAARPPTGADLVIPLFEFPTDAARALAGAARYGEWLDQPAGTTPPADALEGLDLVAARGLARAGLEGQDGEIDLAIAGILPLLDAVGVPVHDARLVDDEPQLAAAGAALGYPVALKATGPDARRPGELGGAALSIHDEHELADTYRRMAEVFGDRMHPAMVQSMVTGAEVAVTAHQHPSFGAVITLGLGGPARSAAVPPAVAVLPLSDLDAERLIARSPVAGLLASVTPDGEGADHLAALLVRLGVVVDQLRELALAVLNPVSVNADGACVLDAHLRLAPFRFEPSAVLRRLG